MKRFIIFFILLPVIFIGSTALAQTGSPGSDISIQRVYGILVGFLCWLSRVAIMIIVIYLIIYALMFFLSQGNPGKMTDARKAFGWGLVGIAVVFGTYSIIASVATFIDPRLDYPSLFSWSCSGTNQGGTGNEGGLPVGNNNPPGGNNNPPGQCIEDERCDQFCVSDPDCGGNQNGTVVMGGVEPNQVRASNGTIDIFGTNFPNGQFTVLNSSGQIVGNFEGALSTQDGTSYITWNLQGRLPPGSYTVRVGNSSQSNLFTVLP